MTIESADPKRWTSTNTPYTARIDFCFAAEDSDAAEKVFEQVAEAIEQITGIPTDYSTLEPMPASEVIKDSPLDSLLQETP